MQNPLYTLFLILISFTTSYAQDQSIIWQNTIGGSDSDNLWSISETFDGGYIIGGWSGSNISDDKSENSLGGPDYWVVKLDALGYIQWENTIGGSSSDYLYIASQTFDGGYILGGTSYSNISGDKTEDSNGSSDYWILKLDEFGVIQWQNTIGGEEYDQLWDITQTSDGGYIIGGYSISDISGDKTENSNGGIDYWIVKLNASGNIQWQNTIGGNDSDIFKSLAETTDGGYIIGGTSKSNISGDKSENSIGEDDYWIIKLDPLGIIEWENTIGGFNSDNLWSISQTSDGGYILGGESDSDISGDKTENSNGLDDYWVVKLFPSGAIEWQNTIGGNLIDRLFSISETSDGGFSLGGFSASGISGDKTENSNGSLDYWYLKIDTFGNIEWQNTIGGNGPDILTFTSQINDGGYILGGYSRSNASGDKTEDSIGNWDYWVLKISFTLGVPDNIAAIPFDILPNPAKYELLIDTKGQIIEELYIYSSKGNLVIQITEAGISPTIDVLQLSSGLYFIRFVVQGKTITKKFVKY